MLINIEQLEKAESRAEAAGLEKIVSPPATAHVSEEAEIAFQNIEEAIENQTDTLNFDGEQPAAARRAPREEVFTAPIDDSVLKAAIAKKSKNLPATFSPTVVDEREQERMLSGDDLVPEFFLRYALIAAQAICRITVRNSMGRELGCATGFMIAPQLLLTNWHVFKNAGFAVNSIAEFDYTLDLRGEPVPTFRFAFRPERFFIADEALDFAIVAVNELSLDGKTPLGRFGYHRLIPETGKVEEGEWITIIQHPGGQRRQYAIRDNEVIKKETGKNFLWYKSDTAQGSSGSPAFNDRFQVVALHHLGRAKRDADGKFILKDKPAVASLKGIDDSEVVWEANEGLRVSVLCAALDARLKTSDNEFAKQLFAVINGADGDIMSNALNGKELAVVNPPETEYKQASGGAVGNSQNVSSSVVTISVPTDLAKPLHLSLGFGNAQPSDAPQFFDAAPSAKEKPVEAGASPAGADAQPEEAFEAKMVEPFIDNDYSTRTGYDENFIGTPVPLPKVTDRDLVSKMDDGGYVVPYEHFSIVINKHRRLALFTASNVDGGKKARKPEPLPGDKYTRAGLTGLVKGEQEKWRTDPRIYELHQLPDKFYNKDRKGFDKGHVVRRDDVCFGTSYAQIRRANGDTYHTTNCSPQVKTFNQSRYGGIWGNLENYVLKYAEGKFGNAPERYNIFAGPVFRDDDEWFEGFDDRGRIRIQIPRKFWKIVIAEAAGNLQAFAFLLEQNLQAVAFEEEFQVSEEWDEYLVGIEELQDMLTGIEFPAAVINADQADADGGEELRRMTEIKRLK